MIYTNDDLHGLWFPFEAVYSALRLYTAMFVRPMSDVWITKKQRTALYRHAVILACLLE